MSDPVSIKPGSMSDSIADWPLDRVIDLLKQRERDDDATVEDCHVSCRSTIRLLLPAIDELALRFGCKRGRMSRWLSFHAANIAQEDVCVAKIIPLYTKIRRKALDDGNADITDILDSLLSYSPKNVSTKPCSLQVYDQSVKSEFSEKSQMCGVYSYQMVQVYMAKSIATIGKGFGGTISEFVEESLRWDRWMAVRLRLLSDLFDYEKTSKN